MGSGIEGSDMTGVERKVSRSCTTLVLWVTPREGTTCGVLRRRQTAKKEEEEWEGEEGDTWKPAVF